MSKYEREINLRTFRDLAFAIDSKRHDGEGDPPQSDPQKDPPSDPPEKKPITFDTQDDLDKAMGKAKAKERAKVLKDLGIEDVDGFDREGYQKYLENIEAQKDEATKIGEQNTKLSEDLTAEQQKTAKLESQLAAIKAGVSADNLDDALALASTMVSEEVTLDEAIAKVIEKYPSMTEGAADDGDDGPKFTKKKKNDPKDDKTAYQKKTYNPMDVFNRNHS